MTCRIVSSIVTAIGLTLVSAATTGAQPQPQVPADAAAPSTPRARSSLDLGVDLFGAVDDALGSTGESTTGDLSDSRRTYFGGNSNLSFERATRTVIFTASGSASYRRFSEIDNLAPSYSGSVSLSGRMTRRTRYDLTQQLSYGPTNALSLFSVGELSVGSQFVPTIDYRLLNSNQLASNTRGSISYNVSRRGSLSASVAFDYAEAPDAGPVETTDPTDPTSPASDASTFQRWDLSARYTHQFSRYMNWYAGYGTVDNISGDTGPTVVPRTHSIDVGVSYSRPLAFSRRTQVTGQIGSQVVQSAGDNSREWRAAGSAGVQHEVGRTWRLAALYVRDTRFVPLFSEPTLTDGVSTSLAGNLTRKSTLGFVANYSRGSVGVDTGTNGFQGRSASVSYRYAFLRQLGLYAEYFLFDFEFENGVALADAITTDTRRHGLRFGVTIGTGLWGNRRRSPLTFDGETPQ